MKTPIKLTESEQDSVRRIVAATWLFATSVAMYLRTRTINTERESLNHTAREVAKDVVTILTEPKA